MSRLSYLPIALALVASSTWALEPSQDWPQWRGPGRENKSLFKGINADWAAHPPALLTKIEGLGGGYASVSISGNRLYTTGNLRDGQFVFAIDLETNQIVWKRALSEGAPKHGYEGSRCTPTIDGDRVYAIASNGSIACLNAADGVVIWQRDFKEWKGKMMSGWAIPSPPSSMATTSSAPPVVPMR